MWENPCDILFFFFSVLGVAHQVSMEFDYIMRVPLLPSHCGFVFGCRISFCRFQSLFDGLFSRYFDFDVFVRGSELRVISTSLSCLLPQRILPRCITWLLSLKLLLCKDVHLYLKIPLLIFKVIFLIIDC